MGDVTRTANRVERGDRWIAALLILLVALATRIVTFGNPLVDMDDQFYWLVGRSMADGTWPILDIWDRKPVGLFLIYGAIAAVSPSMLAVQIAATGFAIATAWTIRLAALTIARPAAASLAALAYLLVLPLFGGQSGQSPVFYNLFVAGAGALLLRAASFSDPGAIRRHALWAMLLSGLALLVKQVSVAEGIFFGLGFLWLLNRTGEPLHRLAAAAALMVVIALLPTIAAFALFAVRGLAAVEAYFFAAYASIFAKTAINNGTRIAGLQYLLIFMLPLAVLALLGLFSLARRGVERVRRNLLIGWIAAAIAGYLLVPNFFPHYALPLPVPLAIAAAAAFARNGGKLFLLPIVAFALIEGRMTGFAAAKQAKADFRAVNATVDDARRGGCIHIVNGPVAIYAEVPACRVTRYLFPYHLTLDTEAAALGVDQTEEVRRLFAVRPAVVVTQDDQAPSHRPEVAAILRDQLAQYYRPIANVGANADPALRTLRIWQRRDLAPPTR